MKKEGLKVGDQESMKNRIDPRMAIILTIGALALMAIACSSDVNYADAARHACPQGDFGQWLGCLYRIDQLPPIQ